MAVAANTALAILLITWGLLLERPQSGVMNLVTSKGPGGIMLRRLALPAVLAPSLFAILSIHLTSLPSATEVDLLFAALTVFSTLASLVVLAITAVHLDRAHAIIEQMRTEARELIDRASDGIFVADLSGRFIDVNHAACGMVGYTREELLQKTVMDLTPPEDLVRLQDQKEQLLGGAAKVNDWNLIRKDGNLLATEVSAKILPDGRWQAFIRDISARKRAERERQFIAELGAALPSTLDVDEALSIIADLAVRDLADFCLIDLVDDQNRPRRKQVRCRNHERDGALCSALGGQILDGDNWNSAISVVHSRPQLVEKLTSEFVLSWGLSDDQASALQARGFRSAIEVPLLARGKVIGRFILVAADVPRFEPHDLKLAESIGVLAALSLDNRGLYRSAMKAARARDDVLGIVAHDLRNPLQVIAIDASGLRRNPDQSMKEIGDEIDGAARRMNRLIQDLLDVTRIEAGQLSVKPSRFPVRELIEDTILSQEVLASAAGVQIRSATAEAVPDVMADRDRILQVLENLIGNALKFTPTGGEITLGAEARGGEVEFSVRDTGSGIPSVQLPHVFDRFWQASDRKRHGAGLGLAIVKGIVEAHGGKVRVTSIPGQGSTFYFSLPPAPVAAKSGLNSKSTRLPTLV
jgi:PAS domain S-box-containing protein